MFRNYIKLAFRNLWKNRGFSAINIIGLSLGLTVCILILLFVQYERNFDSMHKRNIWRLNEVQSWEGMVQPQKVALSMYPMGPSLKNDFPEVKNYTRLFPYEMAGLRNGEKKVFLKNVFWADSSFFHMFDYKLLKGNPAQALAQPNSVVLTEESAANLFGTEDPIGKQLITHNRMDTLTFVVTGIMENVPENSHLQFNALYSFNTLVNPADTNNWQAQWGGNWVVTYLELNDNANSKNMESRFPAFLQKYMGPDITKGYQLFLQSLGDVHKGSADITHDYLNFRKFDESYTNIFFVIALIVLVIACINFVNLSTARAARRAKEVGVRKSIGAHRFQLVSQFLGESILLSFIAMLIAVALVFIFLPFVSRLSEHPLSFSILTNPLWFLYLIGGTIGVGIVSGIYPAVYLSSFRPVKVLKGIVSSGKNKSFGRNVLVVGQFASATFLIISTIFVVKQLNYMRNKDAGFNKDQVLMISGAYKNYARLKEALEGNTLVKGMTGSSQRMGSNFHQTGFNYKSIDGPVRSLASSHVLVDNNFLTLYGIKIVAGRDFTEEGNGAEYIVNESLAKELLKDKPGAPVSSVVGHRFWSNGDTMSTIVGVAKDFNFNTLHNKIETLALVNYNDRGFHDVAVKIDGTRSKEAIAFIGNTYRRIIPNFPFEYKFLDEHLDQLYKADEKVSKVVSILAGVAIIIACLGLLGLASYAAETRVKEIGIRKVLGASVNNIVSLLSKDFLKLVLIANIIAWPLAWLLLRKWLEDYAFHIDISLWVFALAGLVSLLIALIAVSSQTFKAAVTNPVKNLRTE
jgi:putative ABC transport system permease protein